MDDMWDVFPQEAQSFKRLLSMADKDEFDAAFSCITFSVDFDYFGTMRTTPLCPGGEKRQLTLRNRQEYVDLYVRYLLTDSVKKQFDQFRKGFQLFQHKNASFLRTTTGDELRVVLCGNPEYDFDELQKGARYDSGYTESEPYVQHLWRILKSFNKDLKKRFLVFATGTDRVPLGGLKELKFIVTLNGSEPTNRLPTAYTCFNALLLPRYNVNLDGYGPGKSPPTGRIEKNDKLLRLLTIAIEESAGFDLG
eukprot:Selendium_serpulae@DN5702_c0_g1_i3.p2